MTLLHTKSGKGKELCEMLREVLDVPDLARSFTVRFAVDEPVVVQCEYFAKAKDTPQ